MQQTKEYVQNAQEGEGGTLHALLKTSFNTFMF